MSSSKIVPPAKGGLTFIEQLHALSVQLCPHPKVPYITGEKENTLHLFRGSCKKWACPVCGARNGRKWLARLLHHMNTHKTSGKWYFLTVTAHRKMRGQEASLKNLREGWKKLYNRMRRKFGISEYCKVWEKHKDGSFHLHILIRRKISKKWLKDSSVECGMGYQVDSSKSKNEGMVAGYIAKYLLKSFESAIDFPRGLRRIEVSRGWEKLPELRDDTFEWTVHKSRDEQTKFANLSKQNYGKKINDHRGSIERETRIIREFLEKWS